MNEIVIAVNFENDRPTVSGRELHAALEVKTSYKDWFPRMCEYGFVEGKDFNSLKIEQVQIEGKRRVKRIVTDHQLTIDMAKELCMIQRTEIGKRCREYFLEIEKKWNSPDAIIARALLIANHQLQITRGQNTQLLEVNNAQAEKIKSLLPKASYYDYVLNAEGIMPISTIAKDYGKSAIWLNKWLHEQGVQYKRGKVWLLYQKYADMGYVKSRTYTVSDENGNISARILTCWTQKGRLMIYELLKEHGILPLMEQNTD